MIDSSETTEDDAAIVCDTCEGLVAGRRYVQEQGWWLRNFCSKKCFGAALLEQKRTRWEARGRTIKRLTIGLTFLGGCLTPHQGPVRTQRKPRLQATAMVQAVNDTRPAPLPHGWYGPDWPPTEMSFLAALGRDAWLHPLPGPVRRMPRTDARVFGAVRPGNRAVECRNGHCGVDLGGEIWGEHVHAVHDGVVDFVQRGLNRERGGRFVRVSHRNGTILSQYFHLAAIPRGLERGTLVKGGDVIGLLGDTGVKESAPHLHFTISIRPGGKDAPEKYIDPEPLVALWPLRVPLAGSEVGLVTTIAEPGVPRGSLPLRPGHGRKAAKGKRPMGDETGRRSSPAPYSSEDGIPAGEEETSPEGVAPEPPVTEE